MLRRPALQIGILFFGEQCGRCVKCQSGVQTHRCDAHGKVFSLEVVYRYIGSRTTAFKSYIFVSYGMGILHRRGVQTHRFRILFVWDVFGVLKGFCCLSCR